MAACITDTNEEEAPLPEDEQHPPLPEDEQHPPEDEQHPPEDEHPHPVEEREPDNSSFIQCTILCHYRVERISMNRLYIFQPRDFLQVIPLFGHPSKNFEFEELHKAHSNQFTDNHPSFLPTDVDHDYPRYYIYMQVKYSDTVTFCLKSTFSMATSRDVVEYLQWWVCSLPSEKKSLHLISLEYLVPNLTAVGLFETSTFVPCYWLRDIECTSTYRHLQTIKLYSKPRNRRRAFFPLTKTHTIPPYMPPLVYHPTLFPPMIPRAIESVPQPSN